MIDSHAHLAMCEPDSAELVDAAVAAGVSRILTIGIDGPGNQAAVADAERFDPVFAAVGRHPNAAEGFDRAAAEQIRDRAEHSAVRAIGETGLDFYRDTAPREDQRRAFAAQADIASDLDLPLVIHVRDQAGASDAVEEVFATLDDYPGAVVLHCFSAPWKVGEAAERGWHCSFAGNVTYPSAGELREAAAQVPNHLLLVETDSPFLAPEPVRGKPNSPANVVSTGEAVAEARGTGYAELEALVDANAARLFGW